MFIYDMKEPVWCQLIPIKMKITVAHSNTIEDCVNLGLPHNGEWGLKNLWVALLISKGLICR